MSGLFCCVRNLLFCGGRLRVERCGFVETAEIGGHHDSATFVAADADARAAGEGSTLARTVMREVATRAEIIVSGVHE
jgi:hypothetical protein